MTSPLSQKEVVVEVRLAALSAQAAVSSVRIRGKLTASVVEVRG
jgi:hypothetical protein